jgi:hypothetical protein
MHFLIILYILATSPLVSLELLSLAKLI